MSYLRRIIGVLALIPAMTALTVFGGGEQEKYQGEDFDAYGCVTLHELQRVPTDYKNTRVHFAVRFHRAENLWAPFYTPFLPEDFLAFSAWEPDKKLWVKEDHLKDFPFLYMRKDSPDLNLVIQCPPYQMMELYGIVRNDFNNIPWIEVIHIQPCKEPMLHDELLHHMIRGLDALAAQRNEEAIGHLMEALHHQPPLDAAIDIHVGLAKAYMALRNWCEAAEHAHCALDLCPHHDDAREIWQHASQEVQAMKPVKPVPPPPAAQPQPQPKGPQPAQILQPQPPAAQSQPPAVHPSADSSGLHPTDEMQNLPGDGQNPPKQPDPPKAPVVPQPPAAPQPPAVAPASVAPPAAPNDAVTDARPAPAAKEAAPQPVPAVAPAPEVASDLKQALDEVKKEAARQIEVLREESARMADQLKSKDAEIEKQVKIAVDLEGRLRDALAKLELSAKDAAAADARVKDAQAELASVRAKLAASEEERQKAAAALDEARKAPKDGDAAVASLTQKVKALETENVQLREKVAGLEALQAENTDLKKQIASLTEKNGELEKAVADLKSRLAAVPAPGNEEAAKYAKQAETLMAEKADLSNRIQTIGSEREGLVTQLKDRDGRIRSMEIRIQELEEAVKQSIAAGAAGARFQDPNAEPPKPRGRFVGFESRTPEQVRAEIAAYRAWLARQEKRPGAVEKAMPVEPELLEPSLSKGSASAR